jgi:hypothetical protein
MMFYSTTVRWLLHFTITCLLLTATVSITKDTTHAFPLSRALMSMETRALDSKQVIVEKSKLNNAVEHRSLASCVTSEGELQNAVQNAPSNLSTITVIDICWSPITFQTELNFTRKRLEVKCKLSNSSKTCVFDAKDKTRHFNFSHSIVSFRGVSFRNGNANTRGITLIDSLFQNEGIPQGGSLLVFNSDVYMEDCDFQKNRAYLGGAVLSVESRFDMMRCDMVNNEANAPGGPTFSFGYGGAIFSYDSTLVLTGSEDVSKPTIFENNLGDTTGGAILAVKRSGYAIQTQSGYFAFRSNVAVSSLLLETMRMKSSHFQCRKTN